MLFAPTLPFAFFTDVDGNPLEDGYVYIGTVNLNPETNLISVYWDAALTIPASQPIRTLGGYLSNSGSPGNIFVDSEYSITVRNKNGTFIYNNPDGSLVAAATLDGMASQKGVQAGDYNTAQAGGTADAITGDYTPNITALEDGLTLFVRAASANATTTPTFSPDGFTAKTIIKLNNQALIAGDISGAGHWLELQYDAPLDSWVLANPSESGNFSGLLGITATVASNALTITLKANCFLGFRSTTMTSGVPNTRFVPSDISLVISSGSTLGTVNAVKSRIVVIAIDNAGTIELAAVNISGGNVLDETVLISTTAEGGAGGADTKNVFYSTTARTNVPFRVVGYVESTQATAGTWATTPSTVQGMGGNALTGMSGKGYGQTWQNVSGSRAFATDYYNDTGKPIELQVNGANTVGSSSISIAIVVNGLIVSSQTNTAAAGVGYTILNCSATVPPGSVYRVNVVQASMTGWTELR